MKKVDKSKVKKFYDIRKEQYELGDYRALSWNSKQTQEVRFEVLSQIAPSLDGASVLDLGCGFGDFFLFLKERFEPASYLGVDLDEEFIEYASTHILEPEAEFLVGDFSELELDPVDYVFASGSFNNKLEGGKQLYLDIIANMYKIAKIGMAFNMLDWLLHIDNDDFQTYRPEEVVKFCSKFCEKIEIKRGYLDYDFTIYLKR